jgi:hypothetical protein
MMCVWRILCLFRCHTVQKRASVLRYALCNASVRLTPGLEASPLPGSYTSSHTESKEMGWLAHMACLIYWRAPIQLLAGQS